MCRKDSPLNEESHDEPGVELHSDANGVGMGYRDDDGSILAKQDVHPSERNGVVIVPTGNITIVSCNDLEGRSKKENGELVINGTRYWNTDGLTMKRPKVNRVGLRYCDEGWITIYERDAHPPEGKMEYEAEGETIFISTWEPWDPEDSGNDDVTEEEFTNDDELADQDHWWKRYCGKRIQLSACLLTIKMMGTKKYGDAHGLTDGRPDASGGRLGCHEDGGTITDDPPDEAKTENKTKGGTVRRTNTLKELMIAYVDVIAKLIHCTMMIIVMTVLITNGAVSKSECAGIMRRIGSISRKAGWCTEGWREREREKRTQRRLQPTKICTDHIIIKASAKKG
ncbi:5334_t:CDS:2 [Acaulospora morrowiae]|uniref:5334_t:CDS:1 n=1 Tax=Acaulospora morrowiae TaxID=94023 RepID=A0A9N9A4Z0_9GLOM|nr:5334_t:CDS:2 [Acaulospora morrowiae]